MRSILIILLFFSQHSFSTELESDSYGAIKIGMSSEEALSHLEGYISDKLSYDEPYGCYYLSLPRGQKGVHFMVVEEKVSRFDIDDQELKIETEAGVGIGSTKKEVLKAYPEIKVSPHPYIAPEGEYLEVKLPNGNGIIFETDHDIVTSFRLGSYPALGYIEGCL